MSWDARLGCDACGHTQGSFEWNYTHNCNRMANAVLQTNTDDETTETPTPSWYEQLNGLDGPTGAKFLDQIIHSLRADPKRFRTMNPLNGWGDYTSFVKTLEEMRDSVPQSNTPATTWHVHG